MIVDPTYHQAIIIRQRKDAKYLEYRDKWNRYPKDDIVSDFPIHVDLELNTTCNLNCPMCIREKFPPAPALMPVELAMKVIEECGREGCKSMKYQCRGEPLLYPFIVELVEYSKKQGILETMFNTNGTLLTSDMSHKLIRAGLDKIIISMDTHNPELYPKIRKGANFERTLDNIKSFLELREAMGSETPYLRIQMLDMEDTHDLLPGAIEFWSKIADEVSVIDCLDYSTKISIAAPFPEWKCAQPWQRLLVLANGSVIPCTGLYSDAKIIGNVYNSTLKEIWRSKGMEKIRDIHRQGKTHKLDMCKICPMRRKFFLHAQEHL